MNFPEPLTPNAEILDGIAAVTIEDDDRVTAIVVTASEITAHKSGQGGFAVVVPGPIVVDLMQIGGIEEVLGGAGLETGKYTQIRVHVDSVFVTIGGVEQEATVPSDVIRLVGANIPVDVGFTTIIVLDFHADDSLVFAGGGIQFKPTVKLLPPRQVPAGQSAGAFTLSAAPAQNETSTMEVRATDTSVEATIGLAVADVEVNEADGAATLTVTVQPPFASDLTVNYATSDGSAVAPADYAATADTLTIPGGAGSAQFTVAIADDAIDELDETFTVVLSDPSTGDLTKGVATVTIKDDDVPMLSAEDAEVREGAGVAVLTIRSDIPPVSDLRVDYQTADGSATSPEDYAAASGTAVILAGSMTSQGILVNVVNDVLPEDDETFTLHLSNPSGQAVVDRDTATVTILDDDVPPEFDPNVQVQLNPGGIVATWASRREEDGQVEWALDAAGLANSPNVAEDVRGPLAGRSNKRTHRVEIEGVPAGSVVHFNVLFAGVRHPDGPFQVTLPSAALTAAPVGIAGSVSYFDGSAGVGCLVYVRVTQTVAGHAIDSLTINTLANGGGTRLRSATCELQATSTALSTTAQRGTMRPSR